MAVCMKVTLDLKQYIKFYKDDDDMAVCMKVTLDLKQYIKFYKDDDDMAVCIRSNKYVTLCSN